MRRFLGQNLNISTANLHPSASTELDTPPSSSGTARTPTTAATSVHAEQISNNVPLSSTRRAFQNFTLGYGRSNSTKSNASGTSQHSLEPEQQEIAAAPAPPPEASSPVPPTPPSKEGQFEAEKEAVDDGEWDDALKLPFGGSSSSSSSSYARATGLDHAPSNGLEHEQRLESNNSLNRQGSGRSGRDRAMTPDHANANARSSTATISASYDHDAREATPRPAPSHNSNLKRNMATQQSMTAPGLAVSASYAANASSLVDLKDEMMLELLSSDALIHVAQFEILGFDEVEELRKEHSILQNRLSSLQAKLTVEVKIRDAALSISKLYASKRLSHRQRAAAQDELSSADGRVEMLSREVDRLARREAQVRTRTLRHMAAVLALSFRKLEASTGAGAGAAAGAAMSLYASQASAPLPPHPLASGSGTSNLQASTSTSSRSAPHSSSTSNGPLTPASTSFSPYDLARSGSASSSKAGSSTSHHQNHLETRGLLSPHTIYSPTFSTKSSGSGSGSGHGAPVSRFEGAHMYANNRDAIVPGSTSLSSSPSLAGMAGFGISSTSTASSSVSSSRSASQRKTSASSSASSSSATSHARSKDKSKGKPDASPALSSASSTLAYMSTSDLEAQLEALRTELAASQAQTAALQASLGALEREKTDLSTRARELSARAEGAESGRMEMEQSKKQLQAMFERQLQESESQLQAADSELERAKSQLKQVQNRLDENIRDAGMWEEQSRELQDGVTSERREVLAALANTLDRHSKSSVIAKHLPNTERIRNLDLRAFVQHDLDAALRSISKAHGAALAENEELQRQVSANQQSSRDASAKTAEGNRNRTMQLEQLQQEKQSLLKRINRIEGEASERHQALDELANEHESLTARHQALQERYEASASSQLDSERRSAQRIQEVDKVHTERMAEKERALANAEQEKRNLRTKIETLHAEHAELREGKAAFLNDLEEVWRALPDDSALQARLALKDTDEIVKYKAVYLDSVPSPSRRSPDRQSFTPERLGYRVVSVLEAERKLIARLAAHEDHAAGHKAASIRAERLLQESKISLEAYARQVTELEDRITSSDEKDIAMLERLNDLQSALESARAAARKAEEKCVELEKRCQSLQLEKEQLANKKEEKTKIASLENQAEELKEELASAQDELDELRSKESRQRVQLLDELSQLTEEASSLRAQLRAAQRKLASGSK